MIRAIFLMLLLGACFPVHDVFSSENVTSDSSGSKSVGTVDGDDNQADRSDATFWQKAWGVKSRDALLLGMWSLHLDGTGEYFGDGRNNDQGNMFGIQLFGLSGGTFINSHDDRAWYFGPSRDVYSRQLSENTRFDIGYKFGVLYGYDDDLPNVGGITPFIMAVFGFSWKRLGFDIGVLPTAILTGSFRVDVDF